jgi:hemoglobin-like flavoprotein
MLTMQEIRGHYHFSAEEADTLKSMLPIAENNCDVMIDEFYDYLLSIPETATFLQDPQVLTRLKKSHGEWFLGLFRGVYDNHYLHELQRIGQMHVKIGLNAHYVNAAMQVVRRYSVGMIRENYPEREARRRNTEAIEKILDINLDIITASYIE